MHTALKEKERMYKQILKKTLALESTSETENNQKKALYYHVLFL